MSKPVLYTIATNHGFGHSVRLSSIVNIVQKLCPDVVLIINTVAPRWLLESYIDGNFIYRHLALDAGVVQSSSLTIDKQATLKRVRETRQEKRSIISSEASFIKENGVNLVLADIPPLAAEIARAAQVPCWMVGNFGWDFIYRRWEGEFLEIADWIEDCYGQCDRLFRLPVHEKMDAFPKITDVGLTGGNPRYKPEELRNKLAIKAGMEKTVLLTFGGLGLGKIPYQNVLSFPNWRFITFDPNAPKMPNLVNIRGPQLSNNLASIRPVDLMPICDIIVSKPGYSTFSEAWRLDKPIISLSWEDFAESEILLKGVQDYSHHRIVEISEFLEGDWEFMQQPLENPKKSEKLDKNGDEIVAQKVVEYLEKTQSD